MPQQFGGPPQPVAISQEQAILAQAKGALVTLRPRLEITFKSLEVLHDGEAKANAAFGCGLTNEGALYLLRAMFHAQEIQLTAAEKEGREELARLEEIVRRIESPVKLFRPGFPPTDGSAA